MKRQHLFEKTEAPAGGSIVQFSMRDSEVLRLSPLAPPKSDCRFVGLPGADADDLLNRGDEDLAVADLAGAGRFDDRFDRPIREFVRHHHLDLHLGQEVHHVLRPAIELGMTLLPAETLDLGHGKPGDPDPRQRFAHFVQLEWLDHRFDFFHDHSPVNPDPARSPGSWTASIDFNSGIREGSGPPYITV